MSDWKGGEGRRKELGQEELVLCLVWLSGLTNERRGCEVRGKDGLGGVRLRHARVFMEISIVRARLGGRGSWIQYCVFLSF